MRVLWSWRGVNECVWVCVLDTNRISPGHTHIHTRTQVCQWYARDLGGQLFPLLLQCLSPPKAAALRRMLAAGAAGGGKVGMGEEALGGGVVAIKYAPFSFETRPLRRLDEEEEAMLMQM